jgi:inward rectifier potassium channel
MANERRREADAQDSDLGLGTVAPSQIRRRILEKNGNFNVVRHGLSFWSSASVYHHLLNMRWPVFLAWAALGYLGLNLLFAAVYAALDVHVGALLGGDSAEGFHRFMRAFYFSVETSSTIGYGNIIPRGDFANLVMTVESFIGLLGVALMTGLVFARFSRPTANILFSEHALISPYGDGGRAFMFRIVNGRRSPAHRAADPGHPLPDRRRQRSPHASFSPPPARA